MLINTVPLPESGQTAITSYEYNDDVLLKKITRPLGEITEYTYDSVNPVRRSQANLKVRIITPDERGDSNSEDDQISGGSSPIRLEYDYDPTYNIMKSATNGRGITTTHILDQYVRNVQRFTAQANNETPVEKYFYNRHRCAEAF